MEYSILENGNVEYKRQLINFEDWGPDGIKVDTEGNIYVALWGKIGIYSPKGEVITEIKIPDNQITNLCFGRGKWGKTLFITTRKKLYMVDIKKQGFHIPFKGNL